MARRMRRTPCTASRPPLGMRQRDGADRSGPFRSLCLGDLRSRRRHHDGASGLADRARGRASDDRRSGPGRFHLQAGRCPRRHAAGRSRAGSISIATFPNRSAGRCATRPFRTGRSRCGCCCRIAPRSGTASIMPSRSAPTLQQALADPAAFDAEHPPGAYFRYANLNFPVIASIMERASGERFDRLMARLVLEPLGLDACFNWTTCSDAAVARAVVLYEPDGSVIRDDLGGRRPGLPGARAGGRACELDGYRARQQRRPVLAAGRPARLGPRPRNDRPAAAQPRPPWRRLASSARRASTR